MSRKIKYRVWYEEKKKYCTEYNAMTLKHDGEFCIERGWCTISGGFEVEQYTGLKDKNGKEIYEGDIVEIGKYGKYQVIWNEWACKFDFDKIGKREREEPLLSQDWEQEAEVIGNIHENPELLGVENE